MNSITPFKVILSESNYIINGGKVVNYYNPLNFRHAKKDVDQEIIPDITRTLVGDHIYPIGGSVNLIEIFLMASFKSPLFWVPGHNFSPVIDEVWIVRKETEDDLSVSVYGEIENSKPYQMRFDSVPSVQYGYACNLTSIGRITRVEDSFEIEQHLFGDYILTRLFDTTSFSVCNNKVGIPKSEDGIAVYEQVKTDAIPCYFRGNMETQEEFGAGLTSPISLPGVPSIFNYLESHPGN